MRWICIAICVAGLTACEDKSPESGSQTTTENIQSMTDQAHEAVDTAGDKAAQWSQQFNTQMTDWSTKIEEITTEAKEKGSTKAQELADEAKATYEQAKDKLVELKDATADERATIQTDLKNLGEHIVDLYEQAKTALQTPPAPQ